MEGVVILIARLFCVKKALTYAPVIIIGATIAGWCFGKIIYYAFKSDNNQKEISCES